MAITVEMGGVDNWCTIQQAIMWIEMNQSPDNWASHTTQPDAVEIFPNSLPDFRHFCWKSWEKLLDSIFTGSVAVRGRRAHGIEGVDCQNGRPFVRCRAWAGDETIRKEDIHKIKHAIFLNNCTCIVCPQPIPTWAYDAVSVYLPHLIKNFRQIHYEQTSKDFCKAIIINQQHSPPNTGADTRSRGEHEGAKIEGALERDGIENRSNAEIPDYLNPKHLNYANKLAAAVDAWLAIVGNPELLKSQSPEKPNLSTREALEEWLTRNADRYKLTLKNGTPNKTGIQEAARVSNWSSGGRPPGRRSKNTPHR